MLSNAKVLAIGNCHLLSSLHLAWGLIWRSFGEIIWGSCRFRREHLGEIFSTVAILGLGFLTSYHVDFALVTVPTLIESRRRYTITTIVSPKDFFGEHDFH